jgi:hypothetical protein
MTGAPKYFYVRLHILNMASDMAVNNDLDDDFDTDDEDFTQEVPFTYHECGCQNKPPFNFLRPLHSILHNKNERG